MFSHKHYMPIVKSKAGELWTLQRLTDAARDTLTPLIEFLSHKTHSIGTHSDDVCASLKTAWGDKRPVFIDTMYLGTQTAAHGQALERVFTAARSCNVQSIPVTALGRSAQFQA